MRLSLWWGACTWTMKGGNGGNGINVAMDLFLLGPTSKKLLQTALTENLLFLGRLTKLRQTGTVDEYITAFEALSFRIMGLQDAFYMECFISGIKEAI